jgi:molybdopterin-guanine dinucleotide biosynthesis protein A
MGSDKATLRPAGEPLWSRQLNLLRYLAPRHIWISARTLPAWCPTGIETVLDTPPSRGPLSGICACLERLETTHLFVLAVDMPRMTVEHLRKLWSLAQAGRSLIPMNADYFEPLCAIYSKSAAPFAAGSVAGPDHSLQRLARSLIEQKLATPYLLSPEEQSFYRNLNRPEDLAPAN